MVLMSIDEIKAITLKTGSGSAILGVSRANLPQPGYGSVADHLFRICFRFPQLQLWTTHYFSEKPGNRAVESGSVLGFSVAIRLTAAWECCRSSPCG